MSDRGELFTIGELARRTGLSVRTIRFWSDEGIVPPSDRTATGYRLYDTEAVARLDLVRTLRELGIDLPTVRAILDKQSSVADIAAEHVRALDAEIRVLRVQRTVLSSVAQRRSTTEELRLMHKMAQSSAAERQRLIDEFVDQVFADVPPDAPGAHIANGMRMLPSELPDDPSPEQVDAWVELGELVADEDFQARCREMALRGAEGAGLSQENALRAGELAQDALRRGVEPGSAEAEEILAEVIGPDVDREELAKETERFTDARVERYWQLLATLNGWPQREPQVPAMEWFIAALRA